MLTINRILYKWNFVRTSVQQVIIIYLYRISRQYQHEILSANKHFNNFLFLSRLWLLIIQQVSILH